MGINVTGTIQLAFFIAGALGGLAGSFRYQLHAVSAVGNMVVKGFIASVIGGLGSISGAISERRSGPHETL
jgi:branched-chain amino acid transport system permease protein